MRKTIWILLLVLLGGSVSAQEFDFLIKGGHVIDPRNGIDRKMDVALSGTIVAAVEPSIDAARAKEVFDASGLYVAPGFIDLHVHVFYGLQEGKGYANGYSGVAPDPFSFRSGVTTVVDAGSPGWKNLDDFRRQTVAHSKTRVLSFLNIVGAGMAGSPFEQDVRDMDPKTTAIVARQNRDLIVGIKLAHYEGHEWEPVDRLVEAGRQAGTPVMVDFGGADPEIPLDELLLRRLRPGDIFTHAYAHVRGRTPIVDESGRIRPYVFEARERGILFDVGHGGGSFLWRQAVPATQQGFWPDIMGTDLHIGSMNSGMKDMGNLLSKFLSLGMPLADAVDAATWKSAKAIHRDDFGHLTPGVEADIAVFSVHEGSWGYTDSGGTRMIGTKKLQPEVTLRAGAVVWDLNGLTKPLWNE